MSSDQILLSTLQKETARNNKNSGNLVGMVISVPTDHANNDNEQFEYDNTASFAAEGQYPSPKQIRREVRLPAQARMVPCLKVRHDSDDCESESGSQYELPRLSQADLNDRNREMSLSNILDF